MDGGATGHQPPGALQCCIRFRVLPVKALRIFPEHIFLRQIQTETKYSDKSKEWFTEFIVLLIRTG